MSKRIKLTAPAIRSRVEAETVVGDIAKLVLGQIKATVMMDAQIKSARDLAEPVLAMITKELDHKTEVLRAWAEAHPEEFGGLKSIDMVHGVIGWRLGNLTARTCSGWTWDRVLEKIKAIPSLLGYVRIKEEVNKAALIADRETIGGEQLRAIGVKITQDESFFVEPKVTEIEKRQTSEAA